MFMCCVYVNCLNENTFATLGYCIACLILFFLSSALRLHRTVSHISAA